MSSKKPYIQFYADECFPIPTVTYLRSMGYSIVHAFDQKLIRKSDFFHLKISKKLNRILITLDRDFLYYKKVNLDKHPGVIVISVGSATPPHVNNVCEKLLKNITRDFAKDSLVKITTKKLIKLKGGKVVLEKQL